MIPNPYLQMFDVNLGEDIRVEWFSSKPNHSGIESPAILWFSSDIQLLLPLFRMDPYLFLDKLITVVDFLKHFNRKYFAVNDTYLIYLSRFKRLLNDEEKLLFELKIEL